MQKIKILQMPPMLLIVLTLVLSACSTQTSAQNDTTQEPSQSEILTNQVSTPSGTPVMADTATETMTTPIEASAATTKETQATAGGVDCMDTKSGDTLSMLYQWSGMEEENLIKILKPLVEACGIVLKSESTGDQARLDMLVKAATPPDIAFGNVSKLVQFKSLLKPMTDLGVHTENYASYWKEIGTPDENWVGLPVKVDLANIVWYSPKNFQAHGYQVPNSVNDFLSLVSKMTSDGNVPFSMGFVKEDTTGRIGADIIEDILLSEDGSEYVSSIMDGSLPYNSFGVTNAYRVYGRWATNPMYTVGGAQGTLSTNINDAIDKVFSDPPQAMMLWQPGSAGEVIAAHFPNLKFGTDYDYFKLPGPQEPHGSTDWMIAFSDSAAVKALVGFISSDLGGQTWAQVGFENTPNKAGTNFYTNKSLAKEAQILANASGFTPAIEEAVPESFAEAERQGIVDFVNGADLTTVLDNIAAAQKKVFGK